MKNKYFPRPLPVLFSFYILVLFHFATCVKRLEAQTWPADLSDVQEDRRAFFFSRSPVTITNTRVSDRLLAYGAKEPIRSYAIIVSISEYPNFDPENQHLLPAAEDLVNLEAFLKRQNFDEIIVLQNNQATRTNIDWVLGTYLPGELRFTGHGARVLFAYTGHGAPGDRSRDPGALVLGNASSAQDDANLYKLRSLETLLKEIGDSSYQFLALINACNSGGLFYQNVPSGGNEFFPGGSGAHAITASSADELAYGLPNTTGSIFFNAIIKGVDSGEADPSCAGSLSSPDGNWSLLGGGIVRTPCLFDYLYKEVLKAGVNPITHKPYSLPQYGSIKSTEASAGSFFFVTPPMKPIVSFSPAHITQVASVYPPRPVPTPPPPINVRINTKGVADVTGYKVFNPPDTYKILGVNVSGANGNINWPAAVKNKRFKFVYIKSSYLNKDKMFDKNWAGALGAGLKRGAYHVFDFSKSAAEQFELIKKCAPLDPESLPFAIDPEMYNGEDKQLAVRQILQLKQMCSDYFGKPVIIYGNSHFLTSFQSIIGQGDSIWLARYLPTDGKKPPIDPPSLYGNEPWTIWQFAGSVQVQGIPGKTDLNAFFGTSDDFAAFSHGERGVALNAMHK